MRLINADATSEGLKKFCTDLIERGINNVDVVDIHAELQSILKESVTVYDVEGVIKQLENCPTRTISVLKAVKIVKGGVQK